LYLERSNRLFLRFLNSIKYDDFTEAFKIAGEGPLQHKLARQLNEVMDKFREIRAEKEANLHYFETIIQHIGIGIITFRPDGQLLLLNNAAKKLLKVVQAHTIADLLPASPELVLGLQELEHNEKVLVPLQQGSEQANVSLHVIELSLRGDRIRLASLQNIQGELEDKEMEAWNTLIRVLTHEIMNSVTPIASLSASASDEIDSYIDTVADEVTLLREELEEVGHCLQTISRRSDGLIRFVQEFRSLTTISVPQLTRFEVQELLHEISTLMREQVAGRSICLQVEAPSSPMLLTADRSMIEQVLINLVKNAMEAVEEQEEPLIRLQAYFDERSRVNIEVADNGSGMTQEALAKIFVPFYTTKKTGSGIGLSLSRQIMRLHKGAIAVMSELGTGTRFVLRF